MSIRVDSTSWVSGAILVGNLGFGVLGSAIASSGTNGPGYAYNDLSLPADADKEICGRVTTLPSFGTLQAFEDTSFIYTRSGDGADSFAYQLYVDGVAVGSPQTVILSVGGSVVTLAGTNASQSATSSAGIVGVVPQLAGVVNLIGANATQAATSSTGVVSVIGYVGSSIYLTGANCNQSATSSTGPAGAAQYARAPDGDGYRPRGGVHSIRPADIQGTAR